MSKYNDYPANKDTRIESVFDSLPDWMREDIIDSICKNNEDVLRYLKDSDSQDKKPGGTKPIDAK